MKNMGIRSNYHLPCLLIILAIASLLRFSELSLRPMHTDEAVHAFKFAQLLENGYYVYDKHEYHGPTLNYLSLPVAWIKGQDKLQNINESSLRLVAAIFGISLLLLLLPLRKTAGWPVVLLTMSMLALSPPLVYYSRYYIHEVLLIFFNLGWVISLLRFQLSKKSSWLIVAGVFAGLMVATKETWIIIAGGQILAWGIVNHADLMTKEKRKMLRAQCSVNNLSLFLIPAILTAGLLFSSFLSNPAGMIDALLTYKTYLSRAGDLSAHGQPWHYYLNLPVMNHCHSFPFRADLWLVMLGLGGIIMAISGGKGSMIFPGSAESKTDMVAGHGISAETLQRFFALMIIFPTIIFFAIPYKTPWNGLYTYTWLAFPAASLLIRIYALLKTKAVRTGFIMAVVLVFIHLASQVYSDNFVNHDKPCNPFTYAHPENDVMKIKDVINQVALSGPMGYDMHIEVVVLDHGYWPLPWYLRHFSNAGWYDTVEMGSSPAPLLIFSPELTPEITQKLFDIPAPGQRHLYVPLFEVDPELRPGVPVAVYLRKDHYDMYIRQINASLP